MSIIYLTPEGTLSCWIIKVIMFLLCVIYIDYTMVTSS